MSSKINLLVVVRDHLATLKDEATGKTSVADVVTMFVLPAICSAIAGVLGYKIDEAAVEIVVGVFAIFAGLLLNVLVLIYGLSDAPTDDEKAKEKKQTKDTLLRQSFANISYEILVSLLVVVVLWVTLLSGEVGVRVASCLFIFLAVHFFLTLLMVLKRMHVLLADRFGP
ncbi:MAG: hypothetical protein WDM94_06880 [Bauldia sp.]